MSDHATRGGREAIDASFDRLSTSVDAALGIAIADPTADVVYSRGPWTSGVAWSTIKVPLAIAALRDDPSGALDLAADAIENSGNASAEQLWSRLGRPADAARTVQAVIDESGNTDTVVESRRLRRAFTPFGQTRWSVSDQATFAAHLPQIRGASRVIEFMHHLTAAHRWGMAATGCAAKGGWGPGRDGSYLVRQFAILPTAAGRLGIALAAESADGRLETGIDAVNAMADWLVSQLPGLTKQ